MKGISIFAFAIFTLLNVAQGQLSTYFIQATANDVVNELVGNGVTFSNAQFCGTGAYYNGSSVGNKGFFNGGSSLIGISSGVILSTGNILDAPGPNSADDMSYSYGKGGDAILNTLVSPEVTYDAIGVEFDFVPEANHIQFRYVFASEEYNEYVGSSYNDVFGFFISGGPESYSNRNMAIVPGTLSTPVAINNINSGSYSTYYVDNDGGTYNIEYDGFTTVLTAEIDVTPCQTYHMKLIVSDVGDGVYDSGVFLESNSFTSPSLDQIQVSYSHPAAGGNANAVEGCSNAIVSLGLSAPTPMDRQIPFSISGTAQFNVDYTTSPDITSTYNTIYPNQYYVTVPAGSSTTTLTVIPVSDATVESTESISFTLQTNLCGTPVYSSGSINILDNTTSFTGSITPSNPAICLGNSSTLGVNITGGQTPLTYNWLPGGSTANSITVSPSSNSNYFVTVTDACGNSVTSNTTVSVYPIPTVNVSPSAQSICSGNQTDIDLLQTVPNTTFSWTAASSGSLSGYSSGSGTNIGQTITNSSSSDGTVTYTVTPSANGCSGTPATATVTVHALPSAFNITGTADYCPGTSGVNLTIGGSQVGVNYILLQNGNPLDTFPGTGSSITGNNLLAGTYTAYAVDQTTGCTQTMSGNAVVGLYPVPVIDSLQAIDVISCISPDGSIEVFASGGTAPLEYAIDGGAYSSDSSFSNLDVGFYTILVQDANGCFVDSTNVQISSNTGPSIDLVDFSPLLCHGDTTSITIHATGATLYSIDNGATYVPDTVFYGLPAGNYEILVQDIGNCEDSYLAVVSQPAVINIDSTVTNVICGTPGNVTIIVAGGTGSYTYDWSQDSTNHTPFAGNLMDGTYTVTVTDANGCTQASDIIIGFNGGNTSVEPSVANPLCYGDATGSASIQVNNATPPVTYTWSHNPSLDTSFADNLNAGTYYVTISDAYGCSVTTSFVLTEPSLLALAVSSQNISCYGLNNGTIQASASGGTPLYNFSWGGGLLGDQITNLAPGNYSVTVTDAHGCTQTEGPITIVEPDTLILQVFGSSPACGGQNDGSVLALFNGGTSPYTYYWVDSSGTVISSDTLLQGISGGTYSFYLTDANGCTQSGLQYLNEPSTLVLLSETPEINENNLGSINITIVGGTQPYSYLWSSGQTTQDLNNIISGNYVVTVTDANGCIVDESFLIEIPLNIPNAITPNADGFNDNFEITNIDYFTDISIEIFNRWGDRVFVFTGAGSEYNNQRWDGIYKGKELPMGSYAYIIKLGKDIDPVTGAVLIVR